MSTISQMTTGVVATRKTAGHQLRGIAPLAARPVARPATRRVAAAASGEIGEVLTRWAVAAPTMYALVSINEYTTHRYYQHREFNDTQWMKDLYCKVTGKEAAPKILGGQHVEHHAETLDDMSIKTDANWVKSAPAQALDDSVYRGTAFEYDITALMFMQMLPSSLLVLGIEGFSPASMMFLISGSVLLHAMVWNALHPAMHGFDDVPLSEGIPSAWMAHLRDSKYFDYLYENHQGHHIAPKCNFNVCCPMFDHILGTYTSKEEWEPLAKMPARDIPREYYVPGEYARNTLERQAQEKVAAA